MPTTYLQDGIACGPTPSKSTNFGLVTLEQTVAVTTTADGLAASGTITLPANSQLVAYFVDKTVTQVVGGGTATTLPVTVGTAAAGTQYMTSQDMFGATTGRAAPTITLAQVAAMANIGTNTSVVLTVDPNGTISTTQGVVRLTVLYTPPVT
jgi:hypothetical protein